MNWLPSFGSYSTEPFLTRETYAQERVEVIMGKTLKPINLLSF